MMRLLGIYAFLVFLGVIFPVVVWAADFTQVRVTFEQDNCEILNRWRLYDSMTNDSGTATEVGQFTRQLDDPDRIECAPVMEKVVTTAAPFNYGMYFWLRACTSPSIDDCSDFSLFLLLAGCHGG